MRGLFPTSVILGTLVLVRVPAVAAPPPEEAPLETDRGPVGEALTTCAPGTVAIEGGAILVRPNQSAPALTDSGVNWRFPELLLRVGLPVGLEARLGLPSLGKVNPSVPREGRTSVSQTFWTPFILGAKWAWRGERAGVSVAADLALPVEASPQTGEHTPIPRLSVNGGVPINEHLLVKAQGDAGYEDGGPWLGFGGALVIGGAKVDGFMDFSGQRRFSVDRGDSSDLGGPISVGAPGSDVGTGPFALDGEPGWWRWTVGGGVRWRILPRFQLDARIDYVDVVADTLGPRDVVSPFFDTPSADAWVFGAGAAFAFSILPARPSPPQQP